MSPRAALAAAARTATIHPPLRTRRPRPAAPARRRSGTAHKKPRAVAKPRPASLPALDRLLRGPAYIALVGVLLAGIVFFNVGVLQLNHGIAGTGKRASALKRENALLTLQVAKLGSSERIQDVALTAGLVLPQPGDVRYLRTRSDDPSRALRMMIAPDPTLAATAAPPVSQQSEPTEVTVTPTPETAPAPTPTPAPAPAPVQQTPVVNPTPTPATTPAAATAPVAPATGAAVAR